MNKSYSLKQNRKMKSIFLTLQLLLIAAIWQLPNAMMGSSKSMMMEKEVLFASEVCDLPLDWDQAPGFELTANNDTAYTSPVQKVSVDVIKNDVLTCSDYALSIVTPPTSTQGVATVSGDYIVFTPAVNFNNQWVNIEYSIECNNVTRNAYLSVFVSEYSVPLNIVSKNTECIEDMPSNVTFGIREKFSTTIMSGNYPEGFSIPLVGDLNGDGKPEVVAIGMTGTALAGYGRYLDIFDGQTGALVLAFDLRTLGGTAADGYAGTSQLQMRGDPYHSSPSNIAIADVDGDGVGEIIIAEAGTLGRVYCMRPTLNPTTKAITGLTKIWDADYGYKTPYTTLTYTGFGQPSPFIVDMNGDGIPEVIIYNKIYNAQTGKLIMSWSGTATGGANSTIAANTGLMTTSYVANLSSANSANVRARAMVGRRTSSDVHSDQYQAVPAIVDLEGDGHMEIITGTRIHKFNFTYLGKNGESGSHAQNTYTTIEGPTQVTVYEGPSNGTAETYYLNDGFTRVADLDGDGILDFFTLNTLSTTWGAIRILMTVWDYQNGITTLKAANTVYSVGVEGSFGIPFIGDINDRADGWDGSAYTKKLPEICFTLGDMYQSAAASRTGLILDSKSNFTNQRFNSATGKDGNIVGLTYDAQESSIQRRLKISWALEHTDNSNGTGLTMFDFNNDGAFDLCYRDEHYIRVISPKLGATDYIRSDATPATSNAILFRSGIGSWTAYEAPAIADINMDGSADIIVMGSTDSRVQYAHFIRAFEYASGYQKWAPAPPVWNQGQYNPLYINEDLTVPARPQSMLTKYYNGTDSIQPFNGAWIQQPIVQEGKNYLPVYRIPDAVITDMSIKYNSATSSTVTVTIRNDGTASLNSETPIAFYQTTTGDRSLVSATQITTGVPTTIGQDIFPNEKVTLTYNLTGNYNEVTVWLQIMDDGGKVIATNYSDCNFEDNAMAAIDCPNVKYDVTYSPGTVICGLYGAVMLKAEVAPTFSSNSPVQQFQWYKDEKLLQGDTFQTYLATEPGAYRCYVWDGICIGFTRNTETLTKDYGSTGEQPNLTSVPENITKICGAGGSVYLRVDNYISTAGALYTWFKDGEKIDETGTSYNRTITQPGLYQVAVTVGSCAYVSDTLRITQDNSNPITRPDITNLFNNELCQTGGKTVLSVSTPAHVDGYTYQWFREETLLEGDTLRWLIPTQAGIYFLVMSDGSDCSAFSDSITLTSKAGTITVPTISKSPNKDSICIDGGLLMTASNTGYTNPTYVWYKNGEEVQRGSNRYYSVTEEGYYFVVVMDGSCVSASAQQYIHTSTSTANVVDIESCTGLTELCGANSALILRVKLDQQYSTQTYQWMKGGQPVSGETYSSIIVKEAGFYNLFIMDGNCAFFTDSIEITQGSNNSFIAPIIAADPANNTLCGDGSSVYFYVTNTVQYAGHNPQYDWYKDRVLVQSGTLSSYFATEIGEYFVRVVDYTEGCAAVSSTATVTEAFPAQTIDKPYIESVSGKTVVCEPGGTVILQLIDDAPYSNNVSYQWFKDGVQLTGNANYTKDLIRVSEAGNYYLRVIDGTCSRLSDTIEVTTETGGLDAVSFKRSPITGTICADGSIYLYVENTTDYPNATYIWIRDNKVVQDSNIAYHDATQAGTYSVLVVSGDCSVESSGIPLTKSATQIPTPTIISMTGATSICDPSGVVVLKLGNESAFTSGITGYQWYKNGQPLPSGTGTSITCMTKDSGEYRLQVMQDNCSAISEMFKVTNDGGQTAHNLPILVFDPGLSMCNGGTTQIKVSNPYDFPGAEYIWYWDNTDVQTGTDSVYYATQLGTYSVLATYDNCSYMSPDSTISLQNNNIITPVTAVEPTSKEICGDDGSVVIRLSNYTAFYQPATYQWYKNDIAIAGQTNPVLVVDTSAALGVGRYRVRIQNGYDCVTYSEEHTVTYTAGTITKPVISPLSGTLYIGTVNSILISVDNVDQSATAYRWYNDNGLLATITNLSGAVTYSATAPGNYFVQVVYGTSCAAVSEKSVIITSELYADKPILNVLPESREICATDGMATIEIVNLNAYTNPTFEWYNVNTNMMIGVASSLLVSDSGRFIVRVWDNEDPLNPVAAIPSDTIRITLNTADTILKPVITASGSKICGTNGRVILYEADYVDKYTTTAQYRWLRNGSEVQYTTSPSYVATADGTYILQVIDGSCFSQSDPVIINSGTGSDTKPLISTLGDNLQVCGPNGVVILKLDNSAAFAGATFQWYRNNFPLEGETDSLLRVTFANTSPGTVDNYRIEAIFGDDCTTLSDEKLIDSYHSNVIKPVLARRPAGGELCGEDGSVVLYVDNADQYSQDATYYWFKNGLDIVQQGSNSNLIVRDAAAYTVYVVDGVCSSESAPDTIKEKVGGNIVRPDIEATNGGVLCVANSKVLLMMTTDVANYSSDVKYQWYKENDTIAGANLPRLTVSTGGLYYLQVMDGTCSSISDSVLVTQQTGGPTVATPEIKAFPENMDICKTGGRVLIKVTNTNMFAGATYYWFNGNKPVANGLGLSYYYADSVGDYFVQVVTANGCHTVSDELFIDSSNTEIELPVLRTIPDNNIICATNGRVVIGFTNPDDYNVGASYHWLKDNDTIAGEKGLISNVYPELFLTVSSAGSYRIRIIDGSCVTYSDATVITSQNGGFPVVPAIVKSPDSDTICGNEASIMLSSRDYASDPAGTEYIWYLNDVIVQEGALHYYEAKGQAGAGTYYLQVIHPDGCSSLAYPPATLGYKNTDPVLQPQVIAVPSSDTICGDHGVVSLRLGNPEAYMNATFQWYKNNVAIAGADASNYRAQDSGSYRLQVIVGECAAMSDPHHVKKIASSMQQPVVVKDPVSGQICGDSSSVLLRVNNATPFAAGCLYTWYFGNDIVAEGVDMKSYEAKKTGTYYLQVTDGSCATLSAGVSITASGIDMQDRPVISAIPVSAELCGSDAVVELTFTNANLFPAGSYSYQWYKDNEAITPAASGTKYYASVEGGYRMKVTITSSCAAYSDIIDVTKSTNGDSIVKPVISTIPENAQTICNNGGRVLMTVSNTTYASGTEFVWYLGANVVQSSTSNSYLATSTGTYYVMVLEGSCASRSENYVLGTFIGTIAPPVVASTSGNDTVCAGGSLVLAITDISSYSTGATYSWLRNDSLIAGQTDPALVVTQAGKYRAVVVDGSCSSMNDPAFEVKLGTKSIDKPVVTKEPDADSICINGDIRLEIWNTSVYSPSATYTWYQNGVEVQSGTTPSYLAATAGRYYVQVIEGTCSATSDEDTLYMSTRTIVPPTIDYFPQSLTVCGDTGVVVLRVNNTDDYSSATYQWYKNDTLIADQTNAVLSVKDSGFYYVRVIDGECSATLSPAVQVYKSATTINKPVLDIWPTNATIVGGTPVEMKLENVTAYSSPEGIWFRGADTVGTGLTYSADVRGYYRLLVIDGNCAVWSDTVEVKVDGCVIDVPQIASIPVSEKICDGGSALLYITNEGDYIAPTYQWIHNGYPIEEATEKTHEITGAGTYILSVADEGCSRESVAIILSLDNTNIATPLVTKRPGTDSLCGLNGRMILELANPQAYGPTATYKWMNGNYAIAGATEKIYEVAQPGHYRIVVEDGDCAAFSEIDTIVRNYSFINTPLLAKTPDKDSICVNGSIRFDVSNANQYTSPTYVWYRADSVIQEGTNASYNATQAGRYFVQVIDGECSSTSAKSTLFMSTTTIVAPSLSYFPSSLTICGDTGVVIMMVENTAAYSNNVAYQWYRNDTLITGATDVLYSTQIAGDYYVQVVDGNCGVISTPALTVTKNTTIINIPRLTVSPSDGIIMNNIPISMTLANAGAFNNPQGVWFRGTDTVGTGLSYSASVEGDYYLLVIEGNCAAKSAIVPVRDGSCTMEKPHIASIPATATLCQGDGGVLLYMTNDESDFTSPQYQWYLNDVEIPNATDKTYEASQAGDYKLLVIVSDCRDYSLEEITVQIQATNIDEPIVSKRPDVDSLCGTYGRIILELSNPEDFATTATYQWMEGNYAIAGATEKIYEVTEPGAYRLVVQEGNCVAFSTIDTIVRSTHKTIAVPALTKTPDKDSICVNGSIRFDVSNANQYTSPVYVWYRADSVVQNSASSNYIATQAGRYFVQVIDGECSATSARDTLYMSTATIATPQLTYYPSSLNVCGDTGVVVMKVKNTNMYTTNAAYQWYKNGTAINGATDVMFTTTDSGAYYVQILDGNCGVISTPTLNVTKDNATIATPRLDVYPTDASIKNGIAVEMTLENNPTDYTNPRYIWFRGTDSIANTADYSADVDGAYRLLVLDGNCAAWSETINVTTDGCILTTPEIASRPASANVCAGGSVLLYVTNDTSYTAPTYEWVFNGSRLGVFGKTYETTVTGTYSVIVEDGGCSKGSVNIVVNTNATNITQPLITKRPDSDTLCGVNGSIVLELSNQVYSANAAYQWLKDNYAIEGATEKIYEVTQPGHYRLSVEDGLCGALSTIDTIVLDINKSIAKPQYDKVPAESVICQGGSIRYDISNTGQYVNPTYVWYREDAVVQSDVLPYYIATQAGKYFVQVIEGNCSATSDRDSLSMSPTSSIATPVLAYYPQSLTICGDTGVVVLKVENTGSYTNPIYQWYRNSNAVSGETSAMITTNIAGNYYVQIFEGSCAVTSSPLLNVTKNNTIIIKPRISISSVNTQITGGNPVGLKLDNDPLDYTNPVYIWFRGLDSVGTTATFDATVTGTYQLLIVDNNCAVWSNAISVTDADCEPPVPTITSIPANNELCADGGKVLLQVNNRTQYLSPTYQWYDITNAPISGATNPTLVVGSAGTYKLSVTDTGCVAFSAAVVVTNSASGTITTPIVSKAPNADSLCGNNGTIILSIANPGAYSGATYQWMQDNYEIAGATDPIFEVTQPGNYRLMVLEGGCMSLSDEISIGRNFDYIIKPAISKLPDSKTICQGGTVRYTVTNTVQYSANAVYNWYKETTKVQSSGNPVYFATVAGIYYVQVVDGNCGATSVRDTLTTSPTSINPVALITYPSSNNICGDTGVVVMKVTNTGNYPTATYQWYLNGKEIAGATESMYSATDSGTYFVHITSGQCGVKSANIPVTKSNTTIITPKLYVNPSHATIKGGVPVELSLDNDASDYNNPRYIWFRGTDSIANTADYFAYAEGAYRLLVLDGGCAAWSTTVDVSVDGCILEAAVISSLPTSAKVCANGGSVLLYVTNDTAYVSPVYEWVYNGSRTGVYGKTYETIIAGTYSVIVDDEGCSKGSNDIVVTTDVATITKPLVTKRPDADTLCGNNGSIILELSNPGAYAQTATYQWMKDNYAIEGATGKIYEVTEPGYYRIAVLEGDCGAFSTIDTIVRSLNKNIDIPLLTKSPDKTAICVDGSIRYDVSNASAYTSPVFVWYRADVVVQNDVNPYYIATQSGKYFVQVIEGNCSATSDRDSLSMSATSIDVPVLAYYPQSLTICGDTGVVVMQVQNVGDYTNPTYQWYRNGEKITTNGTSVLYSATVAGDYTVQIFEEECGVISSPALMVTKNATTINTARISAFPTDAQISGSNPVQLTLDNAASYSGSVSYIWYRGNDSVGTTYQYDAYVTGTYKLLVIDGNCATWSNAIQVTDASCAPPVPAITSIPSNNYFCGNDGRVLLQVNNRTAYQSPSYQWYFANNPVSGATDPTLEISIAGTYKLEVIDTGCRVYSSDIVITPDGVGTIDKPVVSKLPNVNELCGNNGRIILSLSNQIYGTTATYQWLNDNYEIPGATDMLYEVSQPGRYRLMVREGSCMSLSDIDTVTRNSSTIAVPTIAKVPDTDTVCQGGSIRYSVTNHGQYSSANTLYVWYKDNEEVQNSSSRHYIADDAGVYFVQVIDGNCSSTSLKDTLYMSTTHTITAPMVSTYPSSNVICGENGVVVLRVMNKEIYVNPTYVWYKNGEPISNSNTPMYSAKDSGSYFVQVFEGECAAISSPAIAITKSSTVMVPLQLSYNPTSKRIVSGIPVVITLDNAAADYPTAQYIWFRGNDSVAFGISSYSADTAGTYRLLVVDGTCAIWSEDAVINQDTCNFIQPAITSTPSSLTVCGTNGSVLMTVTNKAAYTAPVTYAWYHDDILVPGATRSYIAAKEAGSYKVFIQDGLCAGYSDPIDVNKDDNGTIVPCTTRMTPASGVICGDTGSVMLILTNTGNYSAGATYQWYKDGLPISGATSSTREVFDAGTYFIQVLDGSCGVVSDTFRITKNVNGDINKPLISASGTKICGANGRVMLSVTNTGDYSSGITYQWFRNNLLMGGETQSTLVVSIASIYRVQIVDGSCGAFSDTINIIGDPNATIAFPVVETIPSSGVVCQPNGSVLLRLTNDTAYVNPVYQWYDQNKPIAGATESSYETTDRGLFRIEVKEGECTTISTEINIGRQTNTSIAKPVVEVLPPSLTICDGGVAMLRLNNASSFASTATYQWYRNNILIEGATDTLYIAETPGNYRIYVEEGTCGAFSVPDTITASATQVITPVIAASPSDGGIYNGQPVKLYLDNSGDYSSNKSYVWLRGNTIAGTDSILETDIEGVYRLLLIDNGQCAGLSDTIRLKISDCQIAQPIVSASPASLNVCGTNGVVILSLDNKSVYTSPVYQWYKNKVAIPGADSSVYLANDSGSYHLYVTEGLCGSASAAIHLTKDDSYIAKPLLSKTPNTFEICQDGAILLSVTNTTSYNNATYVWYKGTEIVQNGALSTYRASVEGAYYVQVIEGDCSSASATETLTMSLSSSIATPVISSLPSSNIICGNNGVVRLEVDNASVYANPAYQWFKDSIAISGATSVFYEATTAGTYSVQVIDGSCSAFDDVAVTYDATSIDVPVIQSSSVSGQICGVNGSIMLSVSNYTVYGANAEYVWYRNNIQVQRSASEVFIATQAGDYTVQVVDGNCSSKSAITTLTSSTSSIVQAVISSVSGNTTLCGVNGVVVLSLDNENDYISATYQWYKYGVVIPQATSPVYTATDTGEYRLIVSEGSCTSVSNMISVTRSTSTIDVPVIASNPANGNIYGGTPVYLTILNEGDFSSPTYQWYRDSRYMMGTQKDLNANVAGKYRLLVIEGNCSAWSNEITLQDTTCAVPVGAIIDTAICEGTSLDLAVHVTHVSANAKSVFYRDLLGVLPMSSTIVTPTTTTTYYVQFVDTVTTCMSGLYPLTITVDNGPTLTSGLHGGIICSGSLFEYIAVSSNTSVTYQWKRLPNAAINDGDSATGSTQAIREYLTNTSSSTVTVTYEFMLTTTDGSCPTASPVLLIVEVLPTGHTTIQTMNGLCYGDTMVSITYQTQQSATMYYKITYGNDALGAGFVPMSQFELLPANQVDVLVPASAEAGIYAGTMEIRIGTCTESYPFTIVISTMPMITAIEKAAYFCQGDELTLTVTASGGNLSYQWYFEGNPISGATSATYTESSFVSSMEGSYYVVVSNPCASITSSTIDVYGNSQITVSTKWEDIILVDGSGQDYARYQWYKDGKPIGSHATEQYYVAPNGLVGTYHVRVYFADGSYIESCPVTLNMPKVVKNILYPSPVKTGKSYTIELIRNRDDVQSSTVEVYDATGKIVDRHIMEDNKINIQAMYAAGVYSVRIIRADGEVIVKKLIVE
jgi:membrane carboxypeptidase/penicillin-binding protein PbpC